MRRERSLGFTMFNYFTLVVALFVVFFRFTSSL